MLQMKIKQDNNYQLFTKNIIKTLYKTDNQLNINILLTLPESHQSKPPIGGFDYKKKSFR